MTYTILGAGLSGISIADHLRRKNIPFTLLEGKDHGGGHIYSQKIDGFTWDEGPHVSFTKHEYVKQYFAANCADQYLEYPTKPTNYFKGNWIIHPAQANMYAVPEPLKTQCIDDVIAIRQEASYDYQPENYRDWINYAFGETFAENFAGVYTKKYWTTEPENLTTDWIGKRIYFPEINDMVESANGSLNKQTHYITKVRYPIEGGYYNYIKNVEQSLPVRYLKKMQYISFIEKKIFFTDGETTDYENLISTLPLPLLIINSDAPENLKHNARKLKCSQVLVINVVVNHSPLVDNHWIYVYDDDFYSTRINFTDLLAPKNGVEGKCGIQVEVYFSDYHKNTKAIAEIEQAVLNELLLMKLIKAKDYIDSYHSVWIDWANVIFDKQRIEAQNEIFKWLETVGLVREDDDLEPMTDWLNKPSKKVGTVTLAGRFAQWKYYWTDDCVMRAKYISENI